MRRFRFVAAAATGLLSIASMASAEPLELVGSANTAPRIPDVSNPPPTGDSRHVCVIHDDLDFYRCVYIPIP